MSCARLDVNRSLGSCRIRDWVGGSCTVSPVTAMATVPGSAMATVSAVAPAAVVRVRDGQVLSSLRRGDYIGVAILCASCVARSSRRCPPQGRPVVITPMTVL